MKASAITCYPGEDLNFHKVKTLLEPESSASTVPPPGPCLYYEQVIGKNNEADQRDLIFSILENKFFQDFYDHNFISQQKKIKKYIQMKRYINKK